MILDTFYLFFKSDSKDAVKDVAELDKRVNTLKDSGKKRSEQESKNAKEHVKQQKEVNETLKETENRYDGLTTRVAQYAAGYFSLQSIASSFLNTVQNNAALQNQADLLGQNSAELKAYGAAAKAAGGSAESLYGFQQSLFERFADLGLSTPEIGTVFTKIREQLKLAGDNPAQREKVFQNFGVPQELKTLLSLGDEDYARTINQATALTASIAEAGKASKEFAAIWAGYSQTIDDINTKLSSKLLPLVKSFVDTYVNEGRKWANIFEPVTDDSVTSDNKTSPMSGSDKSIAPDRVGLNLKKNITTEYKRYLYSNDSSTSQADPLAEKKKELGIPTYDPIIEEQLHRNQMSRAQREVDFANNHSAGISNISVGGGKNVSVKTGDIIVHSAAADAAGIAKDTATELERHVNLAISNMDDGVKY